MQAFFYLTLFSLNLHIQMQPYVGFSPLLESNPLS